MKAGGGSAYVSFLPEVQGGTDKAPPVAKVRNLMDDMSAPTAERGEHADVSQCNNTLQRRQMPQMDATQPQISLQMPSMWAT
jgi:hypothetical protein